MSFINEYLTALKREIDELDNKIVKVDETINEFISFITSEKLFTCPNEFFNQLHKVQSLLGEYIGFLLRFESRRGISESETPSSMEEKVPSGEVEEKGRLGPLKKLFRRRIPLPQQKTWIGETISYGRNILKSIDHVITQYFFVLYLIEHQDVDEDKGRIEYLKTMYRAYLSDLASDVKSFSLAAINIRRGEVEKLLESVLKGLVKG